MSGGRGPATVPPPSGLEIPAEVVEIARTLEAAGHEAWCVGGALRDALLGDRHTDFDLATSATPEEVRRLFRRTVAVGLKYGTVGVLDRRRVLHEVTTFRHDVRTDGRHAVVAYGATLDEDLARRDFTMNAMAYHPLRGEWRDPFGGASDIARGVVRAVGDPRARFREDYLRVLRALRFAARFNFAVEPDTWAAAREAAADLGRLSAERVRDEWFKGLQTARSVARLAELWVTVGAARVWLPELIAGAPWPDPALPRDPAARDPVILTALLCTDPVAALRRLKASNAEVARAAAVAAGPAAPAGPDDVSVRRWLSAVGPAADDLLALRLLRAGAEAPWAAAVRAIRARGDPLRRADLAVRGTDLEALGASGRRVGELLELLLDRVVETPALNTREALLAIAREVV